MLIRRPIGTGFIAIAVSVLGWMALRDLPIGLLPPVTLPVITVRADKPGASALELEEQLLKPLEESLGTVPALVSLEGRAAAGAVEVQVALRADADLEAVTSRLRERLGAIRLPPGVEPPKVLRYDPAAEPVLRLVLEPPAGGDLAALADAARDALVPQIEGLSEVAAVRLRGARESELSVVPDPARLAAAGLGMAELEAAVRGAVTSRSVGAVIRPEGAQRVRLRGSIARPDELAEALVAPGIRLGDVALVEAVMAEPEELAVGRLGDQPAGHALFIEVMAQADAGLVAASDAARTRLGEISRPLPVAEGAAPRWSFAGGELTLLTDRAAPVRGALDEVRYRTAEGGVLAFAVLLMFLGALRPSFTVFIAVPISILATFLAMGQFGLTINLMSLGGIALGLGRLVDDAIVVVESIDRVRSLADPREDPYAVVARGVREVAPAVIASTLTTIAVFIPLAFLPGVLGALFFDQAFTVSVSLVASLAVALGLVPALLAIRSPNPDGLMERTGRAVSKVIGWVCRPLLIGMERTYGVLLDLVLRHPSLGLVGFVAALALGLGAMALLPQRLLPPSLSTRFLLEAELPRGQTVEEASRWAAGLLDRLRAEQPGLSAVALAGESQRYAPSLTRRQDHELALVLTLAVPAADIAGEQQWLQRLERSAMDAGAVSAAASVPPLVQLGMAGNSALAAAIRGQDAELLRDRALDYTARLRSAGCRGVRTSATASTDEVLVVPDNAKLLEAGITLDQLVQVLSASAEVREIDGFTPRLPDGSPAAHPLPIRIRGALREAPAEHLSALNLRTPDRPLPLSAVATISHAPGDGLIVHRDGLRIATIQAEALPPGQTATEVLARLEHAAPLPPGYELIATGLDTITGDSLRAMGGLLALSVFLVLVVMAVQFESVSQPLLVILAVPMAAAGAFPALLLAGHGLDIMSGIGLVMLVGVSVANAIVLVSTVNLRRQEGHDRFTATRLASQERLRPIIMTSLTTILGLLPLAFGYGDGAELRSPLAVAVIGGMVSSTALVLLSLPCVLALGAPRPGARPAPVTGEPRAA